MINIIIYKITVISCTNYKTITQKNYDEIKIIYCIYIIITNE